MEGCRWSLGVDGLIRVQLHARIIGRSSGALKLLLEESGPSELQGHRGPTLARRGQARAALCSSSSESSPVASPPH